MAAVSSTASDGLPISPTPPTTSPVAGATQFNTAGIDQTAAPSPGAPSPGAPNLSSTLSTPIAGSATNATSPTNVPSQAAATPTLPSGTSSGNPIPPGVTSSIETSLSSGTASLPAQSTEPGASLAATSTNNTGFIAGLAVLAVLLVIALGFIAFLLKRKRGWTGDKGAAAEKARGGAIPNNQNSLEKENGVRNVQPFGGNVAGPGLAGSRRVGSSDLSDRDMHAKFAELSRSIRDWAVTYFMDGKYATGLGSQNTALMRNSRTRFLVLRGCVADILVEAFSAGELLGSEEFARMRDLLATQATPAEANEWRSLTASLLERTPKYANDRSTSVYEISRRIDDAISALAGKPSALDARFQRLRQIVDSAADLAMEVMKQSVPIRFAKPESNTFDMSVMEDALQDEREDALQDKRVRVVVFPSVTRLTLGKEKAVVILKAQVLV